MIQQITAEFVSLRTLLDKYVHCHQENGHPKTQTMQTADCRLQTVQTVQTEYFFSDTIVFEFTFDSNFCRSSYKIVFDIHTNVVFFYIYRQLGRDIASFAQKENNFAQK